MFRSPCAICTDLLSVDDLVACPCGHVYHNKCLVTWLERSETCPTCRKRCSAGIKLYFTDVQATPNKEDNKEDIHTIKNDLRKQKAINQEKDEKLKVQKEKLRENKALIAEQKSLLQEYETTVDELQSVRESLKRQMDSMVEKTKTFDKLKETVVTLRHKLHKLERFETLLLGAHDEAEEMLRNIGTSSKTANELASQLIIMKRENEKMCAAKKKASTEKSQLERDYNSMTHKLKSKELECSKLSEELESLQKQLKDTDEEKQNLRKKVDKMQQSFETCSPRGALINRLLQESPAPMKLEESIEASSDIEIDDHLKIVETNDENRIKKRASFISPVHPGAYQRFKKRTFVSLENSGRLRTGFDGLGGRSTVIMPAEPLRKIKKVSRPQKISKFVRSTKPDPPLPSM